MTRQGLYVPDERIFVFVRISSEYAPPRTLTLELQGPFDTEPRRITLDSGLVIADDPDAQARYEYSFVPTNSDSGDWRYRFHGIDATGLEFAFPTTQRWIIFSIA